MSNTTEDNIAALKAVEGYLASKADRGDTLARSLQNLLLRTFPEVSTAGGADEQLHLSVHLTTVGPSDGDAPCHWS